jgi:hypothetical protein
VDGESGLHGQPIAVEISAEAAQLRGTSCLDVSNPVIKLSPASLTDKDHESLCKSPAHSQLGASPSQPSKKHAFGVVQFRTAAQ